jgi:hypothetical protein
VRVVPQAVYINSFKEIVDAFERGLVRGLFGQYVADMKGIGIYEHDMVPEGEVLLRMSDGTYRRMTKSSSDAAKSEPPQSQ